jgi:hypothetical protein
MLSVIMQSGIMLNVIMLSANILIMLKFIVVLLDVNAECFYAE